MFFCNMYFTVLFTWYWWHTGLLISSRLIALRRWWHIWMWWSHWHRLRVWCYHSNKIKAQSLWTEICNGKRSARKEITFTWHRRLIRLLLLLLSWYWRLLCWWRSNRWWSLTTVCTWWRCSLTWSCRSCRWYRIHRRISSGLMMWWRNRLTCEFKAFWLLFWSNDGKSAALKLEFVPSIVSIHEYFNKIKNN